MKIVLFAICLLLAAGAFWANIFSLLPTNPDYDAQWWKVVLSLVAFCYFLCACKEPTP